MSTYETLYGVHSMPSCVPYSSSTYYVMQRNALSTITRISPLPVMWAVAVLGPLMHCMQCSNEEH